MKYKTCYGSTVTVSARLRYMPAAQAGIIKTENSTVLMSYSTPVAEIDRDGWLSVSGLYSPTARRHISAFMREFGGAADFAAAKLCAEKSVKFNIFTAEVVPA